MRIVILGAGRVGMQVARELIEENHDIILIEKNNETARIADNTLDCLVINEDGTEPETLRRAGAGQAQWFIALTGTDAVNIVASGLVASEFPAVKTIARVESPFLMKLSPEQKHSFGLDILINPLMEAARAFTHIIAEGFAERVIPLHDGALQLRLLKIDKDSSFIDKNIATIRAQTGEDFLFVALLREGHILVPQGATRINAGERFYALGKPETLNRLFGKIEGLKEEARRILILGASRISEYIISALAESEKREGFKGIFSSLFKGSLEILVLDRSEEDCRRLVKLFPQIEVIAEDISEEGIFENLAPETFDLFLALTQSQSKNIISAQLAKTLGVKKTIALTSNNRFLPLGDSLEIDSLVSAHNEVISTILAHVRKAHIKTIYSFYEDNVEIVELRIAESSPLQGKTLQELALPKGVLVAFVQDKNGLNIPSGDSILKSQDIIGLVAPKRSLSELDHIFGGR